jgi:hypothetical protein
MFLNPKNPVVLILQDFFYLNVSYSHDSFHCLFKLKYIIDNSLNIQ